MKERIKQNRNDLDEDIMGIKSTIGTTFVAPPKCDGKLPRLNHSSQLNTFWGNSKRTAAIT
jgi:hypothetical protein